MELVLSEDGSTLSPTPWGVDYVVIMRKVSKKVMI